MKIRRVFY